MNLKGKILITVIFMVIFVFMFYFININIINKNESEVKSDLDKQTKVLKNRQVYLGKIMDLHKNKNKNNYNYNKEVKQNDNIKVNSTNKIVKMEITAYTSGYESTGKTVSHPEYKITASGNEAKPRYTVSASRDIPFGTRIRIPEYEEYMGLSETVLVVEDRGGAIKKGKIDIYMESKDKALEWGRRKNVEVIFLD